MDLLNNSLEFALPQIASISFPEFLMDINTLTIGFKFIPLTMVSVFEGAATIPFESTFPN